MKVNSSTLRYKCSRCKANSTTVSMYCNWILLSNSSNETKLYSIHWVLLCSHKNDSNFSVVKSLDGCAFSQWRCWSFGYFCPKTASQFVVRSQCELYKQIIFKFGQYLSIIDSSCRDPGISPRSNSTISMLCRKLAISLQIGTNPLMNWIPPSLCKFGSHFVFMKLTTVFKSVSLSSQKMCSFLMTLLKYFTYFGHTIFLSLKRTKTCLFKSSGNFRRKKLWQRAWILLHVRVNEQRSSGASHCNILKMQSSFSIKSEFCWSRFTFTISVRLKIVKCSNRYLPRKAA